MTPLSLTAQRDLLDLCAEPHRPVEVKALSPELQEHALSYLRRCTKPRRAPMARRTALWCGHPFSASREERDATGEPVHVCTICGGG